jgi:DHA1 family tetracycline resistance protein-like MFS transporter
MPFTPQGTATGRQAAMPFIMLTVLIDMVSIGLIIPVLPALVGSFTHSQPEQVFWYGAVVVAFACANFIGSPILGRLSDAYGRRPVLLIGFCGLALNFFATALATQLWMLIVVRMVGGLMQANMAVANAYVADITPPEERARRFGLLGAMFGLGFIVGPVLGGLLGAVSLRLPFFIAGSLAMLNLLYGYLVLPESLPPMLRRPFSWTAANPFSALRELEHLGQVRALVIVIACGSLAQFTLFSTWVLYTTFKFGWGPLANGGSLAASGIVSVLVQGLLLGRLLRVFSARRLAVIGMLSGTVSYFLFGLATQGWMLIAIILLNLLGATVTACIQSIISSAADAHNQGRTMGTVNSINSLMAVFGPLVGAPLLGVVSHLPHSDWRIGAPFYFCAALQALALVLTVIQFRRENRSRRAALAGDGAR